MILIYIEMETFKKKFVPFPFSYFEKSILLDWKFFSANFSNIKLENFCVILFQGVQQEDTAQHLKVNTNFYQIQKIWPIPTILIKAVFILHNLTRRWILTQNGHIAQIQEINVNTKFKFSVLKRINIYMTEWFETQKKFNHHMGCWKTNVCWKWPSQSRTGNNILLICFSFTLPHKTDKMNDEYYLLFSNGFFYFSSNYSNKQIKQSTFQRVEKIHVAFKKKFCLV